MSYRSIELQKKWKEANDRASTAEARLAEAWITYGAGTGPAPSKEHIAEVARLRLECEGHLTEILDSFVAAPGKEGYEHSAEPSQR